MTVSRHTITAYGPTTQLDVKTANITLDRGWAPYCQAELVIPMPSSAVYAELDPRNRPRVTINVVQDYGDSLTVAYLTGLFTGLTCAAVTSAYANKYCSALTAIFFMPYNDSLIIPSDRRYFSLGVRSITLDHSTQEATITLASDEALLQDYALVATQNYAPGFITIRTVVDYVLSLIGTQLQATTNDAALEAASTTWEPGQTAWNYISPLLTTAHYRLYSDELQRWYLVGDDEVVPGYLTLTDTGTITAGTDQVSREQDWYDSVVVKYSYQDPITGTTTVTYDTASTGTPTKTLVLSYDTAYPGTGAAQRILNRRQGQGRVQSVTAINDYTATPGIETRITLPNTLEQIGILKSVSWNWPDNTMAVETTGLTEIPATAWVKVAAGIRWQDISAGISWATYTP